MVKEDKKTLISELVQTHDVAISEFEPIWKQGYENQRYRRGINWTDKEKKAHKAEDRHPYAIALTAAKFNRHLAEQRANRTQWKAGGRGEEDELQAELDTQVFKYVEDINKFKYTESEVYEDGLGKKYGAVLIDQDYSKNPQGDVILKRWYFDQVLWDVNSRAYDLNEDASFIDRFEWYTKDQVTQMYPEKKETLKTARSQVETDNTTRRKLVNYLRRDKGKDLIKVIWRQQKEYKKIWKVIPLTSEGETKEFDTLKEAEGYVNGIARMAMGIIPTQETAEQLTMAEGIKKNFKIKDIVQTQIKEICWTGFDILEEKIIDWTDKYTIIPFFALNDDGYYFNLIDIVKDPQRGFDRLFSMIDKSMAKNIKGNNYQIIEGMVKPEVLASLDYHMKKMVEGGHILPVLKDGAISPIGTQTNITLEVTLIEMLKSLIEDLFGGNTFQGLDSKRKQTATEASLQEKAARLGTFLFIDNLMRWKNLVGEVVYDCILNTYTYEMKLAISGEALGKQIQQTLQEAGIYKMSDNYDNQGYLTYNKDGKRLRQNKMNVMVNEVEMSDTMRVLQYEQLKEFSADMVNIGGQPIPPELLLKASNIDPTLKAGLQKYYDEQMKMLAEQAKQQANMEEAKLITQALPAMDKVINPPEKETVKE